MSRGRIAVLMPEIYDPLDNELLSGINSDADEIGFDTLVFTSVSSNASDSYICGESNIYELPFLSKTDGVFVVAKNFKNERLKKQVLERLKKSGIHCIMVEEEYENIKGVLIDQSQSIYSITKHLKEHHGYKSIICLTSSEENREARERADGFVRAMNESGLVSDNKIYGDFRRNASFSLAEKIASGEITRPEAIVCTKSELPSVYLGENVFAVNIKSGNEEILTEDICRSLGDLGIYVGSDKLMVISDNVTGVLTDERLSEMYSAINETHTRRKQLHYFGKIYA